MYIEHTKAKGSETIFDMGEINVPGSRLIEIEL